MPCDCRQKGGSPVPWPALHPACARLRLVGIQVGDHHMRALVCKQNGRLQSAEPVVLSCAWGRWAAPPPCAANRLPRPPATRKEAGCNSPRGQCRRLRPSQSPLVPAAGGQAQRQSIAGASRGCLLPQWRPPPARLPPAPQVSAKPPLLDSSCLAHHRCSSVRKGAPGVERATSSPVPPVRARK